MDVLPADSEDLEMEESESGEHRDRLSELPDSLILDMLSLLPMRDVVRTPLLSKRWKDLWTTIPCLDFSEDANDLYRFQNFVNRALARWKGAKILKFKINFSLYGSYFRDVDLWVRFATKNEVEELDISLMDNESVMLGYYDPGYWAPQCLCSCSSIRKLSLLGCNLTINANVQWNQLKSLRIDGVRVSEHAIDQVLSGAPQLEVLMLRIMESYKNLNIQSSSLKKLMIEKCLLVHDDPAKDTMLRIWAPSVEILEFGGIAYSKCLLINVSSLTDANLGFCVRSHNDDNDFTWNELLGETLSHIFPTIHHVEKVTLSDWCLEVIGVIEKKYLLPSSYEVQFLKLNACWLQVEEIMILLEIFPKLKMLVIDLTNHIFNEVNHQTFREKLSDMEEYFLELEADLPKSFLLQLRTVEITWLLREASIFPFIEFLLKHASMLEKIVIRPDRRISPEFLFLDAAHKLVSLQRSFPNVEMILCDK